MYVNIKYDLLFYQWFPEICSFWQTTSNAFRHFVEAGVLEVWIYCEVTNWGVNIKKNILPCLCSWGRKSDQSEGTYLNPASSDYWSAGKTVERMRKKREKQQDSDSVNLNLNMRSAHVGYNVLHYNSSHIIHIKQPISQCF